jgi:hypothetical protein
MISIDFLVILGLIIVISALAYFFGRNKSISVLLSMYLGILFYQKAGFISKLMFMGGNITKETINSLIIYLAMVLIAFFLIKRHIEHFDSQLGIAKAFILGISITLFILAFTHFVIPTESLYNFGPKIDSFFTKDIGLFPYLILPLIILLFL